MDINGKIIQVLEPRTGVSSRTGNSWTVQSFVLETSDEYPRKCVFEVFGEDRLKEMNIQLGETLTVSFDIDAHEYQGRWYNSIRAWRVRRGDVAAAAAAPAAAPAPAAGAAPAPIPAPTEVPAPQAEAEDDLPF